MEKRVRAYTQRSAHWATPQADTNPIEDSFILDAEILAIAAANEVDMHLSGEYRYTNRTDAPAPEIMQAMFDACQTLGVSGLAETARQPPALRHEARQCR